jgi:alpha-L-rhamnosidase
MPVGPKQFITALVGLAIFVLPARSAFAKSPRKVGKSLPVQQTAVRPVVFALISPGHVFIDFGRAAFAGLELRFPQPDAGRKVTVHLGEKLSAPHVVDRAPGGSVRYHVADITLKAGQAKYLVPLRSKDARLMPAEIGPVMPFRYVEIENVPASFTKDDVRQLAAHYPFDDSAADFRCSDEKLNAIWKLSKYSMKATSFGGIFIDGDRERKPYEADAYINQLGWFYTAGEYSLPRHTHEYLITHPTWPTEWIMFSVLMAWDDYLYSGDATSLKEHYHDLHAKTLIDLEREDGLIVVPKGDLPDKIARAIHIKKLSDIVDWPAGERDGYDMRPVNTVVNAFHAEALGRMRCIAAVLGKKEDAARYLAAGLKAEKSINEKLVDPATGLYVDGEGSKHSSLHANILPLRFSLELPDRRERIVTFVRSRGMACSVYGAQFLMDALFDAGAEGQALALMTAPGDRSWRHMVEDVGTTITLEAWDNKYKSNQDWNHAWGAAPANILPRKVLGVEPIEPGWACLRIYPRLGNLKWAEGRIPTPHGAVTVRAEAGKEYHVEVTIPAGATAMVCIPAGSLEAMTVPRPAKALTLTNGRAILDVPAGSYKFTAKK